MGPGIGSYASVPLCLIRVEKSLPWALTGLEIAEGGVCTRACMPEDEGAGPICRKSAAQALVAGARMLAGPKVFGV